MGDEEVRRNIATFFQPPSPGPPASRQLSLFAGTGVLPGVEDALTSASGEL
jgi:hypothetical protein